MIRIIDNFLNRFIFIGLFIYLIIVEGFINDNRFFYYISLAVFAFVWGIYRETYLYKSIQKNRIYIKDTKREFLNNISKFAGYLFLSFSFVLYLLDNPFNLKNNINYELIIGSFFTGIYFIIIGNYRLERNEFEFNENNLRVFRKHRMFAKVKYIKDFRILKDQIIIEQKHSYVNLKRLDLDSKKRSKLETELTDLKSRIDAKNLETEQIRNGLKNKFNESFNKRI